MKARGFTLIEVLVALAIMAVMALLTFTAIDGMLRGRDAAQAHLDQTLRLQTVMAQWEQDLRMLQDGLSVQPLTFDGSTLRLTRATEQGLQLVSWSLNGTQLDRWAAPAASTRSALADAEQQSQLAPEAQTTALHVLAGVKSWQIFFFRDGQWIEGSADGGSTTPPPPAARRSLPQAVRLVVEFESGQTLTRELLAGPAT